MFYYTSHVLKRFIPHVHRERPLNGFENGFETIEYVLLTTSDGNSIFFSAKRARASLQKLPLNDFTAWNFLSDKEKSYQFRK